MWLRTLRLFSKPTSAEIAFREKLIGFAERHNLPADTRDFRELSGRVVGEILLRALANTKEQSHLLSNEREIVAIFLRAAASCYGVARAGGFTMTLGMVRSAAFHLGGCKPLAKSVRPMVANAFDWIDAQRSRGALEQQAEEIMVPRYIVREEPLVLQRLQAHLDRQLYPVRTPSRLLEKTAAT